MKKTEIFSIAAIVIAAAALVIALIQKPSTKKEAENAVSAEAGAVVYLNLDRVLNEYDMANDLRSVAETKVESINQEVNRRGSKLEKEIADFQEKMDKGLMTRSVAEVQGQKLTQKQQEIAEEQSVMMNQIADAINTYIQSYNADKAYSLILTTQGDILQAPVVAADATLDITDEVLAGLNDEYVKTKGQKK